MVRSDARENRERVLAVAREAFAEDDETSMNQIAQRAGVGAGTLYRNFPTREALVLAVYQNEVERIVSSVPGLLAEKSPLEALRHWTTDLVEAMRKKHGLGEALSPSAHKEITEQTYGPVITAITELFDAGKQDGTIRMDADAGDFLQLTGALWRAASGTEDRSPRMLALILDGLRADSQK
ncbi:TetR/AcrR family transcriptional regulator [Aeromicrobium ginsengisoli]|uniref:TetR/AcrR family transcriptional regulator n=1 Tax=Aeromicrobium ginsengisoli TaxID=363867 RepID=A0A5M4FHI1_9ACTN|nr:TetR/AcrR family transcriptional regulator [Aeromicrobium ginsengisoli]KAA1399587.1 TetR/AcrR family transcriptional regulator [Aeromicrobium ginsengisoli]